MPGGGFDSGEPEYEGDAAGECTDGADNDRNGAFDCEDVEVDPDVTYSGTVIATSGTWECDAGFSRFVVSLNGTADSRMFVASFEAEVLGFYVFDGSLEGEP